MKAHRTDRVSLIFALIFLAVAAWWLFAQLMSLTLPAIGWLVAAGLIAVGTLGLVGALRSNRTGRKPAAAPGGAAAEPTDLPAADILDSGPADTSSETAFDRPTTEQFERPTAELFPRATMKLFDGPAAGPDSAVGDRVDPAGDRSAGDRARESTEPDRGDERPT